MNVEVSANFRKQTKKTIFSIFIFGLTYLVLVLFAVLLTFAFAAIGIWLIVLKPMIVTFGIGIGLIASGFTVLYFLIKFIFASTKIDRSHLIEVKETDQPHLFVLIRDIVHQVDTSFPKKVYLSADVNAAVFYDSSFWSMFLPVRKNLQIGIGLMNTVTQQEFKAILAHEFGHFSQRSMKVGSYVYHVNQIIYNMLYKNESLDKMIAQGANVSGYITLFVGVSVFIIKQIQRILQKLYNIINMNYMALSREMEFHADAIAAHVAGSKALSDSLLRVVLANYALEKILAFYSDHIKSNFKSANVYDEQIFAMSFFAEKSKFKMNGDFPVIDIESTKRYNRSKLNIEDQWASHPSNEDRIVALNKLNIVVTDVADKPAMQLLNNTVGVVGEFTRRLFDQVEYEGIPKVLDKDEFISAFTTQFDERDFDDIFNDFYTFNDPIVPSFFNIDTDEPSLNRDMLFSQDYVDMTFELNSLKDDLIVLRAIQNGETDINTFDYDGIRYSADEANQVVQRLEKVVKEYAARLEKYNIQLFKYFSYVAKSQNRDKELESAYVDFALFRKSYDDKFKFYQTLVEQSNFIFEVTPFAEISAKLEVLRNSESKLKEELKGFLKVSGATSRLEKGMIDSLYEYIDQNLVYFHVDKYDDHALEKLFAAINHYQFLLMRIHFLKKKAVLDIQKELLETAVV